MGPCMRNAERRPCCSHKLKNGPCSPHQPRPGCKTSAATSAKEVPTILRCPSTVRNFKLQGQGLNISCPQVQGFQPHSLGLGMMGLSLRDCCRLPHWALAILNHVAVGVMTKNPGPQASDRQPAAGNHRDSKSQTLNSPFSSRRTASSKFQAPSSEQKTARPCGRFLTRGSIHDGEETLRSSSYARCLK